MYAGDHEDKLVTNYIGSSDSWIDGTKPIYGTAVTANMTDETVISRGLLYPYNSSLQFYQCPDDRRWSLNQTPFVRRVRSYSIQGRHNGNREDVQNSDPHNI